MLSGRAQQRQDALPSGRVQQGHGLLLYERRFCVTEVCANLERRDTEKLLFLSRLVQRGVNQTSQGGLERWVHTLTRWTQGTWYLAKP